jgi:protein-S-isoprenylcysteine O-methyltransferase Ste14
MLRTWTRFILSFLIFGILLFGTAGTLAWPAAWAYLGISFAVLTTYSVIVLRVHPDLVAERTKPPADAKRWDRPFVAVIAGVGPVAVIILAGLDRRLGWSQAMPTWLQLAGFLAMAAGGALSNYAVASNRFFSALVRIQSDRGHHVVDSGPYRFVRHPGYVGSLLHMTGAGFALGSWVVVPVALVLNAVLVVRTALEDRTLRRELPGYDEYAGRVRYRLVPGVY